VTVSAGPYEYWDISFAHVEEGKDELYFVKNCLNIFKKRLKIRFDE
jgi:hypothetical protein